jgi:cyclin B
LHTSVNINKDCQKEIKVSANDLNDNKLNKNNNNKDIQNKLKIKLNIKKKTKKKEIIKRINCLNKLDYSLYNNATFYNNKSIDLNLNKSINKSNNITEFYLKDIDKNKTISNNYYFRKNMNNVCRIASKNNIIYNRVIKERKTHISLQNDYLINTHKTQHSCNSTLNHDKQNININNNIIININNSNYETLNTSTNKTIKSKSKNNSKNKKNSVEKNKKISKPKSIKKVKAKAIKINLAEKDNKKYFKIKEKEKEKQINTITKNVDLNEYKNYINTEHVTNKQIPKEYLNVIYSNLLKEEKEGINPKPIYNYMNDQKEINEQMRSILVDWIIDVHHKFGFTDETLFMTVLIIDRYSTIRQISRMQLQLLGITALMISCKHEEIELPKIDDFIYITDNAYTKQEMVKMENDILRALNFSLLFPSPIKFFEYLSINFNFSKKMHFMGKYLMETFLIDIKYIKYKASVISCACAYIVMKFFKVKGHQDSYNKKYYMLDENEDLPLGHGVKDCAQDICFLVDNINYSNYSSCFKKYSKIEFEKVALIIENK